MKKNWFQILSLALNVVLLIALLMTRTELADTQNNLKNQLDSVACWLMDVQDQITLSAQVRMTLSVKAFVKAAICSLDAVFFCIFLHLRRNAGREFSF